MKKLNFIVNKNPIFDKCPQCKEIGSLHRSRTRSFKENAIKKLSFWKIYRCKACGWRGYKSIITITSRSIKVLAFYLFLIFIAAYIIKSILKSSQWNL